MGVQGDIERGKPEAGGDKGREAGGESGRRHQRTARWRLERKSGTSKSRTMLMLRTFLCHSRLHLHSRPLLSQGATVVEVVV